MKKILSLIILSVFYLNTLNAEVTWNMSEDGTLTISGTGEINYNSSWNPHRENIKQIIIIQNKFLEKKIFIHYFINIYLAIKIFK